MATTMASGSSPFNPLRAAPSISSPLASGSAGPFQRPTPTRNMSFARSRPLRPFPSVANTLSQSKFGQSGGKGSTKIIEPPKKLSSGTFTFTLNLTQADLMRQD